MSCGLAVAALLMMGDPNGALSATQPPAVAATPVGVADEPFFADLAVRATGLKAIVDGWSASGAADQSGFFDSPAYADFKSQAGDLAAQDMQGHVILRDRGTDGDLKCILRGISEDMPLRIAALEAATTPAERAVALAELSHLLDDNAAVILAPPA